MAFIVTAKGTVEVREKQMDGCQILLSYIILE